MKEKKFGSFTIITALALAALMLMGCFGCKGCREDDPGTVVIEEPTEAPTAPVFTGEPTAGPTALITPEPEFVSMRDSDGFVKANKAGTYGVGVDGSVRYTGSTNMGQHRIYDWENVVDLETSDTTTAALLRDGTIRLCGFLKGSFSDAAEWTGAVDIAMGDRHLACLHTDGTVTACGENSERQCAVEEWREVIKVVAAGNYTAALTSQGVVTTIGAVFDEGLNTAPVADIDAAADHLVLLLADGTVRSVSLSGAGASASSKDGSGAGGRSGADGRTGADGSDKVSGSGDKVFPWTGIVKVFAAPGATYAIDGTGKLYNDSTVIKSEVNNAYYVAASADHAVVLHGDGTCKSYGSNDVYQGRVSGWRLLPFVEEGGWLMGYGPGTYLAGEAVHTGMQTVYTDPATGESREATFVILGDIDGDGFITNKDEAAMNAHIAGREPLQGAALRAANIVVDGSKPDSIDIVDLEKLKLELAGERAIDRFCKTDQYTAPLADAKRKNADALGYITLKGTNISYPIMYDREWYYNDHNIDRKEIVSGSIYFYWSKANKNIVITGHNARTSGTMFHELHTIQNKASNLKTYKNRVWQINAYGKTGYWEVWSLYEEGAFSNPDKSSLYYNTNWPNTFNALSEKEKQAWIDYQLKKSEINLGVKVSTDDRFMTLVTCGDHHSDSQKGARLYIFLRWIGQD